MIQVMRKPCLLAALLIVAGCSATEPEEPSEPVWPDAAPGWTRLGPIQADGSSVFDGQTPLSDPWVVADAGRYKMWFTLVTEPYTPRQQIGVAYTESADGVRWQTPTSLVLAPTPDGWDARNVETPSVVKTPEGKWHLYYTATLPDAGNHFAIGLATSDDGLTWRKHGQAPVFTPEQGWELPAGAGEDSAGGVLEPCVLYDSTGKVFRMWYAGLGQRDEVFAYRTGYAESADGVRWNRRAEPVMEPGAPGAWDDAIVSHQHVMIDPQGVFHLFYFGSSAKGEQSCRQRGGCALTPGAIGHAASVNGIHWQRDSQNPILAPKGGTWEAWSIGGPSALWENGRIRLWYFGSGSHDRFEARIGGAAGSALAQMPE